LERTKRRRKNPLVAEQVKPKKTPKSQEVWPLVVQDLVRAPYVLEHVKDLILADMLDRNAEGIAKYGIPLMTHNGRDAMIDLYQELLDAAVYCKQILLESPGNVSVAFAYVDIFSALGRVRPHLPN
jgi:hypothetical protein